MEQREIQGEASGSMNEEAAEREQFRRLQDINLRIQTRQRSRKVTDSELKENMEESTRGVATIQLRKVNREVDRLRKENEKYKNMISQVQDN